ncbi:MAG TPA: M14 family metallopeptidase [Xanthomonadales bacterium]|nr:M14 family metallopeptidase [Xanthomonadales bacterium]
MRAGLFALLSLLATAVAAAPNPALTTVAERSGFVRTGRYDEVVALCADFAQAYRDAVRCIEFGRTPEGRPMHALIATRSGALTPEAARERALPVLLFQGGIHAGEIDGKDAGFLALRELLQGRAAKGALEHVVIVFVPVFNVDGHERFGRWNRPNQRGPEEMGWRVTAQNLNLNRDYAKADSPEMQAMLRLVEAWDPILYTDLHATDGAQFEHDVSVQVEPLYSGDDGLRAAGRALRDSMMAKLAEQGSLPLPFYPSFVTHDDPASGFTDGVAPPRFSTGYLTLRNRFGVLVETHSWKDYRTRVGITRNVVVDLVELAVERGARWLALANAADAAAAKLGGAVVPLDYKAQGEGRTIDFRGYAYTRTPSEISGALMTRYDEKVPQVWRVTLRDDVRPNTTVVAPSGGYVVPAAHAARVAERLAVHGIAFRRLGALPETQVEAFRASKASFDAGSLEGRHRVTLEGSWQPERHAIAAGALFVPIAQPKARLVVALLEPQAPDSIAAWGGFNAHFEQKEYMEDYVAEAVAREQLARDPKLAAEFHRRLAEDPAFAQSPAARLGFFHRRHASWDAAYNLYPVLRVADSLEPILK